MKGMDLYMKGPSFAKGLFWGTMISISIWLVVILFFIKVF
jgi:hypothetical protein